MSLLNAEPESERPSRAPVLKGSWDLVTRVTRVIIKVTFPRINPTN